MEIGGLLGEGHNHLLCDGDTRGSDGMFVYNTWALTTKIPLCRLLAVFKPAIFGEVSPTNHNVAHVVERHQPTAYFWYVKYYSTDLMQPWPFRDIAHTDF